MSDKKNIGFKKILSSKFVSFFLLLFLIWVGLVCVEMTYKKYQMMGEAEDIKNQAEKIKVDIGKLDYEKALLGNPSYLEKEAKLRLNLKKEGEEVVILSKENNSASIMPSQMSENGQVEANISIANSENTAKEKNWKKWWKYFFQ